MSELKEYDVTVGKTQTTMRLNDEDAKRLGVAERSGADPAQPDEKAAMPPNKAATPRNKTAGGREDQGE